MTLDELREWAAREGKQVISREAFDQLCAQAAAGIMAQAEASGEFEAFLR